MPTVPKRLTAKHYVAATLLALGETAAGVARRVGVHPVTVAVWKSSPAFQAEIAHAKPYIIAGIRQWVIEQLMSERPTAAPLVPRPPPRRRRPRRVTQAEAQEWFAAFMLDQPPSLAEERLDAAIGRAMEQLTEHTPSDGS